MNKLQPNSMRHKFNDNVNTIDITKAPTTNKKMMFLNFIHQEQKRNSMILNQQEKLKQVLEEVLDKYPDENVSSNNENKSLTDENMDLDLTNIYKSTSNEPEPIIYYDQNEPKLKTISNILYSKHKLDQLIKNKKW